MSKYDLEIAIRKAYSQLQQDSVASSATKLATARNISGISFDGTKDITLGPQEVGADPVGTTAAHQAKSGAHPISGVNGLQAALDAANAALDAANAKITELEKWPQSGSTATTQWIKHKDGTMQATAVLKSYGVAINTPLGQLFQSTEIVNVALPPGFISAPICSFSVEFVSGTVRPIPIPVGGSATQASCVLQAGISSTGVVCDFKVIAYGRWK